VDEETQTLSRDEVVKFERRAWADTGREEGRAYFYDGIGFWYRRGRSDPLPAEPWRTPQEGWRHHAGCNCERCAS
jgi:hypothetical protein